MDDVPKEELEPEIERTHEVQEQIELAIREADGTLQSGDSLPATSARGADHISLEPPTGSAVTSDSHVSPTATSSTKEPLTSAPTLTTSTVSSPHPSRIKFPELTNLHREFATPI